MKTVFVILVAILLPFIHGCKKAIELESTPTYRIDYAFTLLSNDSVGNEWQTSVTREGQILQSGDTITAQENTVITITATVTEVDVYPDTATATLDLSLADGSTATATITVLENGGAYTNHTAVWEWTCSVTRLT